MKSSHKTILISLLLVIGFGLLFSAVLITLKGKKMALHLNEKIGMVFVEGPIMDSKPIVDEITDLRKDDQIKAILIRVESPGGGVGPSQEIYQEIQRTKASKPVVVSMGSLAASGGYYISAAATKIVANPGTITGSIGVIVEFLRFQRLMEKIGLELDVVKMGEFKDMGSPHRPLTDNEKDMLLKVLEDIHGQFVKDVAKGRGIEEEKVKQIADGRIFSGKEAKELGLVDELGNLQDAIEITKELAGIKGEPQIVMPKKKKRLLGLFFEDMTQKIITTLYKLKQEASALNSYGNFMPLFILPPLKTY